LKKIAITGGGTGGHLVIARALKEAALEKNLEVYYFGSTHGQDRLWFENDSEFSKKYFLKTSGVVNQGKFGKLLALFGIGIAFLKARRIIKKENIEAVISVGGYSAAAASFAATSLHLPFYIHEQNATIGKLNATLKDKAKYFFSSYEENPTDYPVRDIFFEKNRLRDSVRNVIFLGGSQGAKAINDLALSLAKRLKDRNIKVIHQCGKNDFDRVKQAYHDLGIEVELFDFSDNIIEHLEKADFAIARAGASTVWELTALQLPAMFVPYPYAANDHQAANAQAHVDANASWMMRETEINEDTILELINSGVKAQSEKLSTLLSPHGADTIIEKVLHV
jgi:UDP-N-acetylglucosamine--N-acetylmuramyl-(pentapeptide) pyrophosphoryl-undecaprenol N-acetylglucosamine transferase